MRSLKIWQRAALALAVAFLVFIAFAWLCLRDPKINFLPHHSGAEWIIFPSAVDTLAHPDASMDTTFRRSWTLDRQPRNARLKISGSKRFELKINGVPVNSNEVANWKNISKYDVDRCLRVGDNLIEIRVFNDGAPPALWLNLDVDGAPLRTDEKWAASFAGSNWRPVVDAARPRFPGLGNSATAGEEMVGVLPKIWPVWVCLAVIAILICTAAVRFDWSAFSQNALSYVPPIIVAALWLILFFNNNRFMPLYAGFDSKSHLEYIRYVQERHCVPLPTKGFEMFHPPLYYALSAAVLAAFRLSVDDLAGISVLRWLTMLIGLGQIVFAFLSLRLLFPNRIWPQLVGLLLVGFLPMQLYLSHYVTNETLVATFVSAAIYFSLRLLIRNGSPLSDSLWLGIFLGAAMLTKATAALFLPPLAIAFAMKLIAERASIAGWARILGLPFAICFVLSGWYYIWIWHHFGTPLVGNWNAAVTGFAWWQDPGYHTAGDFIRFGRSLTHPLFSGFAGIPDGVYSTFWGDGLWGGLSDVASRTPWNYGLVVGGYLLALAPATLIFIGAVFAVVELLRRPSRPWFLLISFCAVVVCAFILMTLKVASHAQIKAFYGLSAVIPLCGFIGVGWEKLTRNRRGWSLVFGSALIFWALNSYVSLWVRDSASQHIYNAARWTFEQKADAARVEALKAVEEDPKSETAHRFLSVLLTQAGELSQAREHAEQAVQLAPAESDTHAQLSAVLLRHAELEPAVTEARRAIELGPENALAYNIWFTALRELQRNDEAISAARDALAVSPFDAEIHYRLGLAAAQSGDLVTAADQFGYALLLRPRQSEPKDKIRLALRLMAARSDAAEQLAKAASSAPDSSYLQNELAWLLATHPAAAVRNGPLALQLGERACQITERKQPGILLTVSAAYAENGNFRDAISAAREAISLGNANGDTSNAQLGEKLLALFQANQPYREELKQ